MTLRDQLLALQWAQLRHDEAYHKDVVIMPLAQRIKHMALHNTKYTAYFLDAIDRGDDAQLERTLVDAFVIALASANTLNQDLGQELVGIPGGSFQEAGARLEQELGRNPDDPLWLVRQFARHNGRLAKLCESWDHLEPVPFREGMQKCILALLMVVLAQASAKGFDLVEAYKARIRLVETRSIFDKHIRKGAGGQP